MTTAYVITLLALLPACVMAFVTFSTQSSRRPFLGVSSKTHADTAKACETTDTDIHQVQVDPKVSSKFKIVTCSSTSCAKKRRDCGLDEFATYGDFYSLIQQHAPDIQLEESPCLGSCSMAPCVGIEHDDFDGPVALEGMSENEFTNRVFHNVITDDDVDRVWECVENAIQQMSEEENDENDIEDDDDEGEWI